MKTWDSSSWPLPEEPSPNQVASSACSTVIVITTRVAKKAIKFGVVAKINNCNIKFLTGESDSRAMASSTLSFMEFTFSTVASFIMVTFSAADSLPSTTFSFTASQM